MSIGLEVTEGEIVPISLQMEGLESDVFPKAIIKSPANIILATRDLAHLDNGEYIPSVPYPMTSDNHIRVQYLIYTDVGRTILSSEDGADVDVFNRRIPSDPVVIGGSSSGQEISGFIEDSSEISGNIESEEGEIIGYIEDSNVEVSGEIEDDNIEIIGIVDDDDEIAGGIDE